MTTGIRCVFVLLMVQSAELLPTTNSIDDLPAKEVNDYRLKGDYKTQERLNTTQSIMKISRSIEKTNSLLISKESVKKNTKDPEKAKTFLQKRIKRRLNMRLTNLLPEPTYPPDTTDIYRASENSKGKTYRWILEPTEGNNPHNPFLAEYIEYGLNQWARVSRVNFVYVPYTSDIDSSDFDIVIKFARGAHDDKFPFDGPGGEIGHTIPVESDDPEEKIELHFDDDEDWKFPTGDFKKERPDEGPDFIEEVMHEGGHVLGFVNSRNPNSVMHDPLRTKRDHGKYYFLSHEDKQKVKNTQGRCAPDKVDAIFSYFINEGSSFLIVGPYTYKIQQFRNEQYATIADHFPRPSILHWNNFEFIDEAFIHTDYNTYFFSGDEYAVHLKSQKERVMLYKRKLGEGTDQGKKYIGWPGLKHHRYINAAMMLNEDKKEKTYIFQDDLVYLWDSNKKIEENDEYHLPKGGVADGWPKKISEVFPGVPNNIDTAFRYYFDNRIYFFKDGFYYRWVRDGRYAKRRRIETFFRNICDVHMCTPVVKDRPCRSWKMPRNK